jgi:DNA polymerase III subunit gamma/tau
LFLVLFDRWSRAVDEANKSFASRLVFEMALVELCQAEPLLPLGDLLTRLETLEARLVGGAPPPAPSGHKPGDGGGRSSVPPASRASADGGWPAGRAAPQAVKAAVARPQINLSDPATVWAAIQTALEKDSPLLASALETAEVESIDQDVIRLRMSESFQMGQVESARARLEALFEKVLGQAMRLQVRLGEGQAPAVVPARARVEADMAEQHRLKLETEAREHPMVRKAQDLFHAGVTGVKILG